MKKAGRSVCFAYNLHGVDRGGLRKTPLFSQLFLCLSRACLGKMIGLYINGAKSTGFSYRAAVCELAAAADLPLCQAGGREGAIFLDVAHPAAVPAVHCPRCAPRLRHGVVPQSGRLCPPAATTFRRRRRRRRRRRLGQRYACPCSCSCHCHRGRRGSIEVKDCGCVAVARQRSDFYDTGCGRQAARRCGKEENKQTRCLFNLSSVCCLSRACLGK
jgi:hypothetical protein